MPKYSGIWPGTRPRIAMIRIPATIITDSKARAVRPGVEMTWLRLIEIATNRNPVSVAEALAREPRKPAQGASSFMLPSDCETRDFEHVPDTRYSVMVGGLLAGNSQHEAYRYGCHPCRSTRLRSRSRPRTGTRRAAILLEARDLRGRTPLDTVRRRRPVQHGRQRQRLDSRATRQFGPRRLRAVRHAGQHQQQHARARAVGSPTTQSGRLVDRGDGGWSSGQVSGDGLQRWHDHDRDQPPAD